MPEEKGQPLTGQTEEAAPAKEQGQEATPTTEKFKGKSPEEIIRAYEELEKKLGEQGQAIGQLRTQNEQLVGYLQQLAKTQVQPQQAPTQEQIQWDWDNPLEAARKIAKTEAEKELERKLQNFYWQLRSEQAATTSQFAKSIAKQMRPDILTPDVEPKVEALMRQALQSASIDPRIVEDPKTWVAAAAAMRALETSPNLINPIPPQLGEMPIQTKRRTDEEEPVELDQEMKEVIEKFGFDPDKFAKELKQERKRG